MKFYVQNGYSDEAGDAHKRIFIDSRVHKDSEVLVEIEAESWADARDQYKEQTS